MIWIKKTQKLSQLFDNCRQYANKRNANKNEREN